MSRLKSYLMPALLVILASVVVHDRFLDRNTVAPTPSPRVDGAALGRAYGPVVLNTLGEGWVAAAQSVSDGKSIAEAQQTMQETWLAERRKYFVASVAPEFAKVLPEGTEPKNADERAALATLWREFARGLKGGR